MRRGGGEYAVIADPMRPRAWHQRAEAFDELALDSVSIQFVSGTNGGTETNGLNRGTNLVAYGPDLQQDLIDDSRSL